MVGSAGCLPDHSNFHVGCNETSRFTNASSSDVSDMIRASVISTLRLVVQRSVNRTALSPELIAYLVGARGDRSHSLVSCDLDLPAREVSCF